MGQEWDHSICRPTQSCLFSLYLGELHPCSTAKMPGSQPSSPSCHSTLAALPPPAFLGKAPPFVLATKIRKKWDICKANEACMAGSCTPSKAEANCALSTQSKWMGERQRETFEVNDGMGYLLRKSGGHRAHVQLLMRVVTVAVWSLEQNNRFQNEYLDQCRNTMWRPAEHLPVFWTTNTLIPITIKQVLISGNWDVDHLRVCLLK